jgi:glycosyltransferase involved in cell wall biosynthesis
MPTLNEICLALVGLFMPRVRSNLAVDAGDRWRERADWQRAAMHYRRALSIFPDRRPIWVQLGHALKESGDDSAALDAYRRASALPGDDGDAPLHHALLAKRLGLFLEAKERLRQAARENPQHEAIRRELVEILLEPLAAGEAACAEALALAEQEAARLAAAAPPDGPPIVFDIADLVSYFRHSRLPTGIQRVQIEVVRGALSHSHATQVACFGDDRNVGTHHGWVRIPAALTLRLSDLALSGQDLLDSAWLDAIEVLAATLRHGDPVTFPRSAFLVNLGTSWWLQNYFLHVRAVQRAHDVRYVPFVHDFVPVIMPEHCVRELVQDFCSWVLGVFDHADFILTNSRATMQDLHRVAGVLGREVAADHVAMIPLDADFRRPELIPAPADFLAANGLKAERFALFVATIEARKNHLFAFQAWRALIDRLGVEAVPDLVCVGNRGWLNDPVHAALEDDLVLASKVRILSQLTDAQLALLYGTCAFTVYTSRYEGWGLPVTESLCYGKVPVVTRCASLPEAGGEFAVYVEPDDTAALVEALDLLIRPDQRAELEARIAARFRPRNWTEVARQIEAELGCFARFPEPVSHHRDSPVIAFNTHYRLSRNRCARLEPVRACGEKFRSGTGWWSPEDWGCAVKPNGGTLAFLVPNEIESVRCWLRLRWLGGEYGHAAIDDCASSWRIRLSSRVWQWISVPAVVEAGEAKLHLRPDEPGETNTESASYDHGKRLLGIAGLIVSKETNHPSSQDLALAVTKDLECPRAMLEAVTPTLVENDDDHIILLNFPRKMDSGLSYHE